MDNEKPIFIVRPNTLNALFPLFLKNSLIHLLVSVVPFAIFAVIQPWLVLPFGLGFVIGVLILLSVLLAGIRLIFHYIVLKSTKYFFYKNHLVKEYRFISIKIKSMPYEHITNIETIVSLWDRISRAGDILMYSAEESESGMIRMKFVAHPHEVEKKIHALIIKSRR